MKRLLLLFATLFVSVQAQTPASRKLSADQVSQLKAVVTPDFICSVQSLQGDDEAAQLRDQLSDAMQCGAGDKSISASAWNQFNLTARGLLVWEAGKHERTQKVIDLLTQFGLSPVAVRTAKVTLRIDQPQDDGKQHLVLFLVGTNK